MYVCSSSDSTICMREMALSVGHVSPSRVRRTQPTHQIPPAGMVSRTSLTRALPRSSRPRSGRRASPRTCSPFNKNYASSFTVGHGRNSVMSVADTVIAGVKAGALTHVCRSSNGSAKNQHRKKTKTVEGRIRFGSFGTIAHRCRWRYGYIIIPPLTTPQCISISLLPFLAMPRGAPNHQTSEEPPARVEGVVEGSVDLPNVAEVWPCFVRLRLTFPSHSHALRWYSSSRARNRPTRFPIINVQERGLGSVQPESLRTAQHIASAVTNVRRF